MSESNLAATKKLGRARRSDRPPKSAKSAGGMIDHFRIMRSLGQGGMGTVYLARDTKLGRKVALKMISPEYYKPQDAEGAKTDFLREARTTAQFVHPNIVAIHAVGEHHDRPYVALEYVEGESLADRIDSRRPGLTEGIRIGFAIAEALEEAHRRGVLHLDLKPSNVMIDRDGRPRVLDFGLARSVSAFESDVMESGSAKSLPAEALAEAMVTCPGGSPGYMAPEQWRDEPCSGATDVWALGLIFYELFAGYHPFAEESLQNLALEVCKPDL